MEKFGVEPKPQKSATYFLKVETIDPIEVYKI
jgi:hypothetical protein